MKAKIKKPIITFIHVFIGWILCGSIIGIGRNITSMQNTLIIHAIGAAIIFVIISLLYFKQFNYTTPRQTAIIFITFIMFMDFLVIALFVEKSFEMFRSLLGTWLPFALIFLSTYFTGLISLKRKK